MTNDQRQHFALVGLLVDLTRGQREIKQITNELGSILNLQSVSCIYKRDSTSTNSTLYSELVCTFRVSTSMGSLETQQTLQKISEKYQGAEILLLSYNKDVLMLPGQTLPHPNLIKDSVLLRCSSEVWGEYEHPILGQTLNEIVDSNRILEKVEFYSQGSALL